jgi:hypothetical protein
MITAVLTVAGHDCAGDGGADMHGMALVGFSFNPITVRRRAFDDHSHLSLVNMNSTTLLKARTPCLINKKNE